MIVVYFILFILFEFYFGRCILVTILTTGMYVVFTDSLHYLATIDCHKFAEVPPPATSPVVTNVVIRNNKIII